MGGQSDPAPLLSAAAAYYLPRHLAPNPTYPHLYPPYLIRGYPDTAALENRQTIINDYITSQQMHHNAATAMAQRADMLRGLSPRESSLALNYAAGPRGGWGRALAGKWVGRPSPSRVGPSPRLPGPARRYRGHGCAGGLGGVTTLCAQTWQVVEGGVCCECVSGSRVRPGCTRSCTPAAGCSWYIGFWALKKGIKIVCISGSLDLQTACGCFVSALKSSSGTFWNNRVPLRVHLEKPVMLGISDSED